MFGYIKPHTAELRIYEYELYKSIYCGLCKTAGKRVSFFSRLFLSYDFAFMALLKLLFTGEKYTIERARCAFKPYKNHPEMRENESLRYCAAAFSIFTYYKIADNAADSRGLKRLVFKLLLLLLKSFRDKPKKQYPVLCRNIEECLFLLWNEEKNPHSSVDSVSNLFGKLAAAVIGEGAKDESKDLAEETGFQLGRFIYICDALDDLESDQKQKSFNPFLKQYETQKASLEFARENMELLMYGLNITAVKISEKYKSSPLSEISVNVLSLGCLMSLKKIIFKNENTDKIQNN